MKPKPRSKADPIDREIERALRPGAFIRYGECFSFVSGLETVAATVDKLITADPSRAVELYETFLAGCHPKADELDDSSGSFGQFAQDVICGWIRARQASVADPGRTASTLLWRAQGLRIVDAKKSKYYAAALSNFERARDCYQKAGLSIEWEKTVRHVCGVHYRKSAFMSGFQALAAGAKRAEQPSFLERAKARWGERHGGDHS